MQKVVYLLLSISSSDSINKDVSHTRELWGQDCSLTRAGLKAVLLWTLHKHIDMPCLGKGKHVQ